MSVHVLRAQGVIFSDLTCMFGANPARFQEILVGKLYPESWDDAVTRLSSGEIWHPEIGRHIELYGHSVVLEALKGASPSKIRFQRELKRQRRRAPFVGVDIRDRRLPSRR
ncbi:MAG: hypothetical protein JWM91_322 [Rhodospirillales bacterium]|nr:hypothetical protein [Rhodospirillales bacterium]